MRRIEFNYEVISEVEITGAELLALEEAARSYSDFACRSTVEQGGVLHAWRNQFEFFASVGELTEEKQPFAERKASARLRWRDIDLLCKVCESPSMRTKAPHLWFEFSRLLQESSNELMRIGSPS